MTDEAPFFRTDWVFDNLDMLALRTAEHVVLTLIGVGVGVLIAFPLTLLIHRRRRLIGQVIGIAGILYAIPSLALFGLLIPVTGIGLVTAEIALVSYTLLILIRNGLAGLDGIAPEVLETATGMGYTRAQRLWRVELPLALPVIIAGIRIATVTTIGLVAVTALIGQGGLGFVIIQLGIRRDFDTAILVGVGLSILLAVIADRGLVLLERALTPWARAQTEGT
ncbi:MAG TPA: ABC transporter permease [Candidatus Limnocylindria bacterium]|jgi:osmoprotectant transport system permease protein